jgi:hypothetical protein
MDDTVRMRAVLAYAVFLNDVTGKQGFIAFITRIHHKYSARVFVCGMCAFMFSWLSCLSSFPFPATHTYTHSHARTHIYTFTCTHTHLHIHTHARTLIYEFTHTGHFKEAIAFATGAVAAMEPHSRTNVLVRGIRSKLQVKLNEWQARATAKEVGTPSCRVSVYAC